MGRAYSKKREDLGGKARRKETTRKANKSNNKCIATTGDD
jgi:hypothetical protein